MLVLAGGGVLGEAWMTGLVAGIEDASGADFREADAFVGTSAGAIVAAHLAAGRELRRPRSQTAPAAQAEERRSALEELAVLSLLPIAATALRLEDRPGALLRGALLRLVPPGQRSLEDLERSLESDGSSFDGRLRVVTVDRISGRRVVFGAPGAPPAPVPRAVAASCAIPGYYQPIRIGGREYVDGGAWSQTNLDAAPAGRGTHVLCLNPIAGLPLALGTPLGAARRVMRSRLPIELAALRGRGARVRVIGPAHEPARAMQLNLMDPRPARDVLAGGYAQGLALGAS